MLIFLLLLFSGSHLSFLIQQDKTKEAFHHYDHFIQKEGKHDSKLLHEMAFKFVEQGLTSQNPETEILSLFGAGVAMNDRLIPMVVEKLDSNNPQIQLIALMQLSKAGQYLTSDTLVKALKSDFLLIRLEALLLLAEKKAPITAAQTEALMQKTPEDLWEVYPQILAQCKDKACLQILKHLLMHPLQKVRLSALLSIKTGELYELLPQVRPFATHSDPAEVEIAAATLGAFKDAQAIGLLTRLTRSPHEEVRLSALYALYQLGNVEKGQEIVKEATNENLAAIQLLGKIEGGQDTLEKLIHHPNPKVKINACLALLKQKNKKALPLLLNLMTDRGKDIALVPTLSPGKTLLSYRIIPSAKEQFEANPKLAQMAMITWQQTLVDALEMDPKALVAIAKELIEKEQIHHIPLIINLLENDRSEEAVALLKKEHERPGDPLVRGLCTLALFRIEEEGPYKEKLKAWILSKIDQPLFHLNLPGQKTFDPTSSPHELTPDETSALFIEAIEAICINDQATSIDLLYKALKNGNPANRPALAALLLRTLQ